LSVLPWPSPTRLTGVCPPCSSAAGHRRLFTQDGGHRRGRTDPVMEPPKVSRLVLYTDLGERPDPAMEAPDRPSKEGNKHRSHRLTLGTGEGKRGGARREATFSCVCSRRSCCVLGAPLGPTVPPHSCAEGSTRPALPHRHAWGPHPRRCAGGRPRLAAAPPF